MLAIPLAGNVRKALAHTAVIITRKMTVLKVGKKHLRISHPYTICYKSVHNRCTYSKQYHTQLALYNKSVQGSVTVQQEKRRHIVEAAIADVSRCAHLLACG